MEIVVLDFDLSFVFDFVDVWVEFCGNLVKFGNLGFF